MKLKGVISAAAICATLVFSGCSPSFAKPRGEEGVSLGCSKLYLTVGESVVLNVSIKPEGRGGEISWSVSEPQFVEVADGVVTAIAPGKGLIKATLGGASAVCEFVAADIAVDTKYTPASSGFGVTRFVKLSDAVAAASAGAELLLFDGEYDDDVFIDKDLKIEGVGDVKIMSLTFDADVIFEAVGITFFSGDAARECLLDARGATLVLNKCAFVSDDKRPTSQPRTLGVKSVGAAYVGITGCSFSSLACGVYADKAVGDLYVTDNVFEACELGVYVDVRRVGTAENYPTQGSVGDNVFVDTPKQAVFLYFGEPYDGALKFADFKQKSASKGDMEQQKSR